MPAPTTIPELIQRRAQERGDSVACCHITPNRGWAPTSWRDYWREVTRYAAGLRAVGLRPGDRLAILLPTCRAWDLIDKAALTIGAVVVGVDPHAPAEHVQTILRHSRARAVLARSGESLAGLDSATRSALAIVITLEAAPAEATGGVTLEAAPAGATVAWTLDALAELGAAGADPGPLPGPKDPAVLVYTSGTTGTPKGILYTHEQITASCAAITEVLGPVDGPSRVLCWLPLANLFQRMVNLWAAAAGCTVYFIDEPERVLEHVRALGPVTFMGVPRVFEKLHHGIQAQLDALPPIQRTAARVALWVGRQCAAYRREDRPVPRELRILRALLDNLVLRELREALGGSMKFMLTGSAPCPQATLEFFEVLGVPLLEAYGMSENIIPMSMNRPGEYRVGSVGRPTSRNEVTIAEDGEILVRGLGVFSGYEQDPDPASRFTPDRYLRTGDYGRFDEQGFLYLTGRKSDLLKTSTGRRIAAVRVESVLRSVPGLDQIVVLGNGRRRLVAVATLDRGRPEFAAALARGELTALEPGLRAGLAAAGGALAPYERIAGLLCVREGFSVAGGELTANLKVRRDAVERKYVDGLEDLFKSTEQGTSGAEVTIRWLA
ncbi:AMP-dependent synthetase/ligase [Nannocystis radixulma]|uniref:AMP-binding protein n=1 Tax=Nannocystis radixulma TaxID=2995305 RepID=A0ABT5AWH2_9BACT|nr:AMP-binding protein [Nannocystis radixulma]MDC0666192.1 AMP-binding protein [Nannocystis radixulma]